MTDALLDDFLLWTPGSRTASGTRARFTSISSSGSYDGLLLRDIHTDVVRDGSGDWLATYTEDGRTYTARSDSHTGAILTLIARRCGLDGEIRGHVAADGEEQ